MMVVTESNDIESRDGDAYGQPNREWFVVT